MATPNPTPQSLGLTPGQLHDDSLLDSLVLVTKILGRPCTPQQLTSGLPLEDNKLSPSLLSRAAARAQCNTKIVRRNLGGWSHSVMPVILFLNNQRTCVLLKELDDNFVVHYPETAEPTEVPKAELVQEYSGLACFVQPKYRNEERTQDAHMHARSGNWFWRAMIANWRFYRDAVAAALLINIFALVMPLYTMNIYDRVIPNSAVETLWALTIGIALAMVFNLILTAIRAYVVDIASKRVDVELSSRIMEQVLDLRMENKPTSVGSFASNLRSFESVRDFIASASLTTLVDLPFVILFLAVLAWISPYMVIPPVVAIILILIVSFYSLTKVEKMTHQNIQTSAKKKKGFIE